MSFGICNLPIIPLKREPSHRSELISQLLFGESFEKLDQKDHWLLVRLAHEGYEGWIDEKQQTEISETVYKELRDEIQPITDLSAHAPCIKIGFDEMMYLLPGSTLPGLENDRFNINNVDYLFLGLSCMPDKRTFSTNVEETARFYLNAPYVWGGRSLFGMDCSGFVQVVYKHFGSKLRRDACQQAGEGRTIDFLQKAKTGDLAFFGREDEKIDHVGIILNPSEIIHASGRVKIDRIDEQGIFSGDLNRYTHQLKLIKRMI